MDNRNLFVKLHETFEICLEKSNFSVKLPEKSQFLGNLPGKIEFYFTRIHDPKISNQIDAADRYTDWLTI